MSSNEDRRAAARARLNEHAAEQARKERLIQLGIAGFVLTIAAATIAYFSWTSYDKWSTEKAAKEHNEAWASCLFTEAGDPPEKVDTEQYKDQPDTLAQAKDFNKQVDKVKKLSRKVEAPRGEAPRKGSINALFDTTKGEIPVTFDRALAPCNVFNIESLLKEKYFDDSPCHRITLPPTSEDLQVLQCGDPTGTGMGGPGYGVQDEQPTHLEEADGKPGAVIYPRGTLAMAKSNAPNSAGSQFFFVINDSTLPADYSVMGTISDKGLKILDMYAKDGVKSTDPAKPMLNQVPKKAITIKSAKIVD